MPRLAEVVAALDRRYDPTWAEPWDAVGLVCGDPEAPVRRVLLAVDPVAAVAEEARAWGADLLVTHHPLFLRPVHGVPATTAKGRVLHRLLTGGIALYVAHTNADVADPGVSDALAAALDVEVTGPLAARPGEARDKLVTFVPQAAAERLVDALADAGAGVIGDYTRCAWTATGVGTFRPGSAANPVLGRVGEVAEVPETRVEMVLPRARRAAVLAALRAVHPYEEPAYDVYPLAEEPGPRGTGRVGRLARPEPLGAFADRVARALPATGHGVRVAGDLQRAVRTVAVCGGAGDGLLGAAAAAGVDAYLTADLRHHPASEAREQAGVAGGPALVDAAHWATEWPWLADCARGLVEALGGDPAGSGATVETRVSTTVTDPWTTRRSAP